MKFFLQCIVAKKHVDLSVKTHDVCEHVLLLERNKMTNKKEREEREKDSAHKRSKEKSAKKRTDKQKNKRTKKIVEVESSRNREGET